MSEKTETANNLTEKSSSIASANGVNEQGDEMPFTAHLEELRIRLAKAVIAAIIGFLCCYGFSEQLFQLLMQPLVAVLPKGNTLIFTSLPEGFFTYLKVAFLAGIFVVSPYIFYQLWQFISPGLYAEEKKYMLPLAFLSAIFFLGGALFGYLVVFPFGFQFFIGFANDVIQPMPSLQEYFSFSTKLLFAFGLIFELPLVIFFLARMGLVSSVKLKIFRKYFVFTAFVVAAILTPPDVVSQILMALPLIVLYEIGIIVAKIFGKNERKKGEKTEKTKNDKEKTNNKKSEEKCKK